MEISPTFILPVSYGIIPQPGTSPAPKVIFEKIKKPAPLRRRGEVV